jgi:hypothetical protein
VSEAVSELLSAAQVYAARGWRVIPLHDMAAGVCSCRKGADCATPGKHPRLSKWTERATIDTDLIRAYWERWPEANIGIVTGLRSRLLVLDVDPRNGGEESLKSFPDLPLTLTVRTGGGGWHYYLQHPGNGPIHGSVLADGLELKADGQYVIAPPSLTTGPYEVQVEAELADAPASLLEGGRRNSGLAEPLPEKIPDGSGRHRHLVSAAGTMQRRGFSAEAIEAALQVENRNRLQPPKSEEEVRRIARSVARYPPDPVQAELDAKAARHIEELLNSRQPSGTTSARPPRADHDAERFQFERVNWEAIKADGVPQLDYLDEPFLPCRKRIWAAGPTESGKSIWAAYKARQITLRGGLVIYVSQENGLEEEARRFLRLRPDFDLLHVYVDQGLDLTLSAHRDALFTASEGAALVVLDTYSACWGGDEDSNRALADFDRDVMKPMVTGGPSLLVLDHTGNPQPHTRRRGVNAPRGASSKGQKCDFLLEFRTVGDDAFQVTRAKKRGTHGNEARRYTVIDGADDTLDLSESEVTDEKAADLADGLVEVIHARYPISTGQLRDAAADEFNAGTTVIGEALRLLKEERPPRVVCADEVIETEGGRQSAKAWRPVGDAPETTERLW